MDPCWLQVQTDLAAIPTDNTDRNYVDRWLEQEMKKYREEKNLSITRKMIKLLGFGSEAPAFLAIG